MIGNVLKVIGGLVVVLFVLAFIGALAGSKDGATRPGPGSAKPASGFAMPGKSDVVTFAKFNQIANGMTYQQVVDIIGAQGEELSRNKINGVPGVMPDVETVMYQWMNSNGSNMNAMFQNNALMQKAQFGLK